MKISTKSALFISAAALLLFLTALLVFCIDMGFDGVHTAKSASETQIMTGRDDPDSRYIELIPGQQVDINTADKRTLQQLPGIGDVLSRRIIDYREQVGSFDSIEDIMLVDGIDKEDFNEIKDMIGIGAENENTGS